jgi:hypothetical protein
MVELKRFRQFVDQRISIDPRVTIIVGKNDTGKTGFLRQFFDQHFYEGAIHSRDRPQVPGFEGNPISFSLRWEEVSSEDFKQFPLAVAFGSPDVRTIEVSFQQDEPTGEEWTYSINGVRVSVYTGQTRDGRPRRREVLAPRRLFPAPHYISVPSIISSIFEARLYDLPQNAIEAERIRDLVPIETTLLRVAGVRAETRHMSGRGVEEPWPPSMMPPTSLTLDEIDRRLSNFSQRLTEQLRRWWHDPPGLTFRIKIGGDAGAKTFQRNLNSYGLIWEVVDQGGLAYHGAGLYWFISFLVELLYVDNQSEPLLLLFDEPATPLHPSAQRTVAKLLNLLSVRNQIIYSTHSPFMIDWNFPQRIRLFRRDYESKQTYVDNTPYRPTIPPERIWDPLRSSIGVTLGDVAVIGEGNILVEGITDQILLANASALIESRGRAHIDLARFSIIPFGEEPVLQQLIAMIRSQNATAVVVTDADKQGERIRVFCERSRIPFVQVNRHTDRSGSDAAIEDVIGLEDYIKQVNRFYADFPWFSPLDANTVRQEVGNRSLGAYLQVYFEERFGQNFSKTAVAIHIADHLQELSDNSFKRLEALLDSLLRAAA